MSNIQTNLVAEFNKRGISTAKFTIKNLRSLFEKNGVWIINGQEYDSKLVGTIFANCSIGPGNRIGESVKRGQKPLFIKHAQPATYSFYNLEDVQECKSENEPSPESEHLSELLENSINNYQFPSVYYDFRLRSEVQATSMTVVEQVIKFQLTSHDLEEVKQGLANVVYWGNANAGFQMHRTLMIFDSITDEQLIAFQKLVSVGNIPTLSQIRKLKIPQFSGISFISKIIAFLDPDKHCVLDLLLSRLAKYSPNKAIGSLVVSRQIRVTKANENVYERWCQECLLISRAHFKGLYRAVDIERGFFKLIQDGRFLLAAKIYNTL